MVLYSDTVILQTLPSSQEKCDDLRTVAVLLALTLEKHVLTAHYYAKGTHILPP